MTVRTKGIDISRAQEQFDFTAAVSAGVKFELSVPAYARTRTLISDAISSSAENSV